MSVNSISKNFNSFLSAFKKNENESWISFIGLCFKEDPKQTLLKLYKQEFLSNKDFLRLSIKSLSIPENYRLLFQMAEQSVEDIISASAFISKFSKNQLLQGVANLLEKRNTELKYNASWNIKYTNGDVTYLETERQMTYLTSVGIGFQELLNRFYQQASKIDEVEVIWNEETDNSILILFTHLEVYNELKDTVERHLFFNWTLDVIDDKTLKTSSPPNQREGKIETDIVNSIKSKLELQLSDRLASESLMKGYFEKIKNGKPM